MIRPEEKKKPAEAYTIRHRWLSTGGEWQVVCGRKVVHRCDVEPQAINWIKTNSSDSDQDRPAQSA